ncbi:putative transcription factor interactor and regulator CCHC(Zn) family [Rosa chinensis]|uniref:Putative transcription factor interactor and regulator CCHC(Zn) family n=1 Tax=Rosa chinensis TaxID=74649 RepID=A0A2P6RAK6_ROSCH|nr:putative transcription factor interactor and regulator CCHC(Zn) family [Rosa chinensis]
MWKVIVFLACFRCEEDMRRVLDREPWDFDKSLIVMAPLGKARTVLDVELNSSVFWVQALGVPWKFRTPEVAKDIGGLLGVYKEVKVDAKGYCSGHCLCIRVRLDISLALLRCSIVEFPEFGDQLIEFRYERLPEFCQQCGLIGHPARVCFDKLGIKGLLESERPFPLSLRAGTDGYGKRIGKMGKMEGLVHDKAFFPENAVSVNARSHEKSMLQNSPYDGDSVGVIATMEDQGCQSAKAASLDVCGDQKLQLTIQPTMTVVDSDAVRRLGSVLKQTFCPNVSYGEKDPYVGSPVNGIDKSDITVLEFSLGASGNSPVCRNKLKGRRLISVSAKRKLRMEGAQNEADMEGEVVKRKLELNIVEAEDRQSKKVMLSSGVPEVVGAVELPHHEQ